MANDTNWTLERSYYMRLQIQEEQKQIQRQQINIFMKILELSASELECFLSEAAQENPLLEANMPERECEFAWTGRIASEPKGGVKRADNVEAESSADNGESLEEYLSEQIAALHLEAEIEQALRFLAGNLDERGYLIVSEEKLHVAWGSERFNYLLSLLQGLEPAGVGARNLAECLTLQLQRQGERDPLMYQLVENYMEQLGRGQIKYVAQELRVRATQVEQAKKKLVGLTPKPGNGFGKTGMGMGCILPDVEVVYEGKNEELRLIAAEQYLPNYTVSSYYASLLQNECLNTEEREYFQGKLRAARWIIECVDRRRTMLLRCARIIMQAQSPFFKNGKQPLHPLSVQELSEQLSVHPSTVYRVMKGKYIACRYGTYPFSDFLVHFTVRETAEGRMVGKEQIVYRMRMLIHEEKKSNPLSDQAIADQLCREGITISRRTVSKYREEALLPAATARRER